MCHERSCNGHGSSVQDPHSRHMQGSPLTLRWSCMPLQHPRSHPPLPPCSHSSCSLQRTCIMEHVHYARRLSAGTSPEMLSGTSILHSQTAKNCSELAGSGTGLEKWDQRYVSHRSLHVSQCCGHWLEMAKAGQVEPHQPLTELFCSLEADFHQTVKTAIPKNNACHPEHRPP